MNSTKRRLGDRRGRARFEIVGQLWGAMETIEPLVLHNLSHGGALIEARLPLPLDSVQRVRLSAGGRIAELQARVRHLRPLTTASPQDRYMIGLEFVSVPPDTLADIDRLVREGLPLAAERSRQE